MSGADTRLIPDHQLEALTRYLEHGIRPGSFLTAVLVNDLREAVRCADELNRELLPVYVAYLSDHVPAICWGSEENVTAWIDAIRSPRLPL